MNKLSYYISNYCDEDDINYLKKILGKIDALDFNFNDDAARNILNVMGRDERFLTIFHKLYNTIVNDLIFINNDILGGIIVFNQGYYSLLDRYDRIDLKRKNSEVFSDEQMKKSLHERLDKLTEKVDDHPFKEEFIKVFNDRGNFSLREEFNLEKGKFYPTDLNAASLITPSQTISRFNDAEVNGIVGSGSHDKNFREITRAVYGKNFGILGTSRQDIKIRYVNSVRDVEEPLLITVEIPIYINSSQKKSLELLNEEIKRFEKESEREVNVNTLIVDYDEGFHGAITIEDEVNLDAAINSVNVDDSHVFSEKEVYLAGFPNDESHYESNYVLDFKKVYDKTRDVYLQSNPNLTIVSNSKSK